jgi:hypothetical protein
MTNSTLFRAVPAAARAGFSAAVHLPRPRKRVFDLRFVFAVRRSEPSLPGSEFEITFVPRAKALADAVFRISSSWRAKRIH